MNETRNPIAVHARTVWAKEAAVMIRKAIKNRWPKLKASVRMGDCTEVRVGWTDGPSSAEMNALIGAYQGKGFGGMIDMAYSKDSWIAPDFSASHAATRGTEGSRGVVANEVSDPVQPGSELVSSNIWLSLNRHLTNEYYWAKIVELEKLHDVKLVHYVDENAYDWEAKIRRPRLQKWWKIEMVLEKPEEFYRYALNDNHYDVTLVQRGQIGEYHAAELEERAKYIVQ